MLKYTSPKAPSERLVDSYDPESTTEEQMLAIAAQYLDEEEAATKEDESRPTYGRPLTGEAYKEWDKQNPRKTAFLGEEYDEKLGIIFTNNLSRWLMDRPPATLLNNPIARVYSIDAEENAQKPGVQELRKLREEKPEYFADIQVAEKAHGEIMHKVIAAVKADMDDTALRELNILGTVSRWAIEQQMTRVVYELRALGLTDEAFGELCQ